MCGERLGPPLDLRRPQQRLCATCLVLAQRLGWLASEHRCCA